MAAIKKLPREPTVPPRSGFVGTFLLAGCLIGVMGVGGAKPNENNAAFRKAMAAPAELPDFKGNVVAIQAAPFWSEELGAIDKKRDEARQMASLLKSKNKP